MLLAWLVAVAAPEDTPEALSRVEETLRRQVSTGALDAEALFPCLVVSTEGRYEQTVGWYDTEALATLQRAFGQHNLRACPDCATSRTTAGEGRVTVDAGAVGLDEVSRLDAALRGDDAPARTGVWLDETAAGVSVRIVDLQTARILYAQNADPQLSEQHRTRHNLATAAERVEQLQGRTPTHSFVDLGAYPKPHVAIELTDQWGRRGNNLTGVSISPLGPVLGVGVVHYRSMAAGRVLIGAKLMASVPQVIARQFGLEADDFGVEEIDPLFTGVGVVRVPIGGGNFAALGAVSTTGTVSLGLSLMNLHLLPRLP